MVCYARPVSRLAAIVLVVFLVFGRPVRHFFGEADLMAAVTVAIAGAAVAAALVFAAALSARRRRAATGGCVSCQFRCQHAMTEQPGRLWLVSTADRGQAAPVSGRSAGSPGPAARPLLPIQPVVPRPVRDKDLEHVLAGPAPRWPDRPVHRAGQQRERAGARA